MLVQPETRRKNWLLPPFYCFCHSLPFTFFHLSPLFGCLGQIYGQLSYLIIGYNYTTYIIIDFMLLRMQVMKTIDYIIRFIPLCVLFILFPWLRHYLQLKFSRFLFWYHKKYLFKIFCQSRLVHVSENLMKFFHRKILNNIFSKTAFSYSAFRLTR